MKIMRVFFLSLSFWLASVFPVLAGPVDINPFGALFVDRQAVTATATALASHASGGGVCLKAMTTNTITVYYGTAGVTTATGFELTPGEGACLPIDNSSKIFVIASTTGASVTYYGTN